MHNPNDTKRVDHEIKASFGLGLTVCSLLLGLLFTSNLYSQTPPADPSGLTATALSSSQIDLSWTDNASDEDGFKIERKEGAAGVYAEIATVGVNVTAFSNSGLNPNTQYFYRVRASNTNGNSGYSNAASATTLPNPPNAPTALAATPVSSTQINLTWTDNADNEIGFKIERKISGGTFTEITTVDANVTNYSSTGLTAVTQYFYRVRAYNSGGNSAYADSAGATTLPDLPAAPTNLLATAVSNSQINLAWTDNAANESGVIIERGTASGGPFTTIDTVGADETDFADTGLSGGTTYYYRIRAYNAAGNSAPSNEASAMTLPDSPDAPSSLTYALVGNTQVDLSWADNANNELGFGIERKSGAGGTYAAIDSVDAGVMNFSNTGLTPGTQYFYRVFAYNGGGNSAYSNEVSVSTPPTLPAAPSNLTATVVNNTEIDLTWTDNASNETGFKIERKIGAAGTYAQIATVGADVTSYANTGLAANTQYFYRVRAYNASGNSAFSNAVEATTLPNPPAAPSNLAASVMSNTQINLTWADNASNEDGFKIERKTIGGAFAEIATVAADVAAYSDNGLSANTLYRYRVRAFNAGGNSAYTDSVDATTLPNLPDAPSGLAAIATSNTQINLAWTDNAANEDSFKIERKTGLAGTYTEIATLGPNVTNYNNTGLASSTEYYYRVRASNTGGNSSYSNEANATTFIDPPAAPNSLAATTVSNAQIDLAWTDNANNEEGFKIERKTGVNGTYAEIATAGANVNAFSNTGLNPGTGYFYRVRAFNGTGNSDYSNHANALTLIKPPLNLVATAAGSNQIDLTWTDQTASETGFKIERKTGIAGTFAEVATVGANITAFSNNGLDPDTQYFYRVRAFNANNTSPYTNEAEATTATNPPSNLATTTGSHEQIDLAWTDNANNDDGFKIERKTGANGIYAEIATVGANVTTFSNTGLNPDTEYFYRVRAFNGNGHSGYSNEANALTMIMPPINLMATAAGSNQIDLTWTDQTAAETGFKIERKTGIAGTFAEVATVGANVTAFSNNGLDPNTQYFYRVRAFSANNTSPYTNEADATTAISPPTAPSNLAATPASHTQIDLAWTDNANNEDGFKIERKTGVNGTYAEIATVGANVTTFSNAGLNPGTGYFYRIRAFNGSGNSDYSNQANTLTMIKAPINLVAAAAGSNQIDLTWTDQTATEAGFKIERKTGVTGTFAEVATVGANITAFSNTGLDPNTQYFYRVRAFSANNTSPYTNEAGATTAMSPPAAPSNLAATPASHTQIDLTWTDNANNETGFKIERKTGVIGTYAEIATVGANVTTFSNTGLNPDTEYFYRVRAFNGNGHSGYSNEANALTLLMPPINLAATAVSSSQIDLTWTDQTATETGFKIERKTGVAGTFAEVATVGADMTAFSNNGLDPNTQYFYRVRAFSANNTSPFTNEANATTALSTPAAPSNLAATPVSHSQIHLTWTDNANNETGFKIERKTGANGTYAEIATVGVNVNTFSSTGLNPGTGYFYRVRAFNGTGNSDYSNEANALTLIKPPINLVATAAGSNQINLTWTDQTATETGFKIERKTGIAGTFAEVATVGANVTVFSNNGLDPNTQYFYRVRAFSANNTSPYTNEADATTALSKASESETLAAATNPSELFLAPNYPNPFNPSTTISYSLPEGMHVTLTVINLAGQEVAALADGYQERGVYRLTFKAANLPTGIYYAVLRAGEVRQVQRMILAK